MPNSQPRIRSLTATSLVVALVGAMVFLPQPMARADAPSSCGRTILVLDESGSVAPQETTVRAAVTSFLTTLVDTGVEATVVEFGRQATIVFGSYLPVDATNLADSFGPYIDATAAGEVYDAPSASGPSTNWDDALDDVTIINDGIGIAPIVLFLTDGDPTAYNLDHAGEAGGVLVSGTTPTAVDRAIEEATEISAQGSHLIAVGVGSGLTNPSSIDRLKQVAGPNVYDGSGVLDLAGTDVVLVPDFEDLPDAMALIAAAMCADPEITVEKTSSSPFVIPGTEVTFSIDVTNTGNVDLHDVTLDDPLVPGCSLAIGDLAVGQTVTVECAVLLWGPMTNTATAIGTDPFGTPVDGSDSATTAVIASGTGTPGFWKNHPGVWPIIDDILLIGDWDHDWTCDAAETCYELTKEQALAALGTAPRGDMTWNMARHLVAAWLNVSAGNDSSCIADTIEHATAWLIAHPIGSQVSGSDPAWGTASGWTNTLDDYNNGLLCAEHRDSGDNSVSGAPLPADEPGQAGGNPPSHSNGRGNRH